MRAQLRKPGACGVLSLEVKYDPASRLKCTATLIIDDIQHSRKSCHDEYEFKTVPFTIPCCKLHFYHPKLLHIKLQFSKRNKQTPLLPLPEINSIYHAESAGSRDQPRPGSFLKKREEPGNEVVYIYEQKLPSTPQDWSEEKFQWSRSSIFTKKQTAAKLYVRIQMYKIIKMTIVTIR